MWEYAFETFGSEDGFKIRQGLHLNFKISCNFFVCVLLLEHV